MKKRMGLFLALSMIIGLLAAPVAAQAASSVYAPAATKAQIMDMQDKYTNSQSASYMIQDGDLYRWGSGVVTPEKVNFGEEKVKIIRVSHVSQLALTESGKVYGWGGNYDWVVCPHAEKDGYNGGQFTEPQLYPQSDFGDEKVVDIRIARYAGAAKTESGKWYFWGTRPYVGIFAETKTSDTRYPFVMSDTFKTLIGGREIADIQFIAHSSTTLVLTTDGELFVFGTYSGRGDEMVDGKKTIIKPSEAETDKPYQVTAAGNAMAGRKVKQISSANVDYIMVLDDQDCVWTWGSPTTDSGSYASTGREDINLDDQNAGSHWSNTPKIAFNAARYGKSITAIQAYKVGSVIYCDDNTIYAAGMSANQWMGTAYGTAVNQYVQVLETVSAKETILSVAVGRSGANVITATGNSYFAGDNSSGAAGNGTTDNLPAGEVEYSPLPDMPPMKPQSKNQLSMTIATTTLEGNPIVYSSENGNIDDVQIKVGQRFTVNIYMEDFAKINAFYIPLSFDPQYLQVVDDTGRAYSKDAEAHPGFNGKSGLKTKLKTEVYNPDAISTAWIGGVLTDNASLPVVDNETGYVSVMGVADSDGDLNCRISGKQLMYSIEFVGIDETPSIPSVIKTNFDITSEKDVTWPRNAQWFAWKDKNANVEEGWDFEEPDFFDMRFNIVPLDDMLLNLYRDETTLVQDKETVGTTEYYTIDKRNLNAKYRVVTSPSPVYASYPNMDSWTCEFADSNGTTATVSDYIQILENDNPTYFEFQIDPIIGSNTNVLDSEDGTFVPAYIKITGINDKIPNTKNGPLGSRTIYIMITDNVPAPGSVSISNKDDFNNPDGIGGVFRVNASSKIEFSKAPYNLSLDDTFTFRAAFTLAEGMEECSKDVKWELLNVEKRGENGEILQTKPLVTDTSAPVVITDTPIVGEVPTCSVKAQTSTDDTDDIVLKLSSAIDPEICDYVSIDVRLAPYAINYPSDVITLVYGEGLKQTYNLKDKMTVSPVDAVDYTVEYISKVQVVDNRSGEGVVTRTQPNVTVDPNTGIMATVRADAEYSKDSYDLVTVQAKVMLKGKEQIIQKVLEVHVVNAVPPSDMYIDVINNAGATKDYIKFSIGTNASLLNPGDDLTLYRDFASDEVLVQYTNLTAEQIKDLIEIGFKVPAIEKDGEVIALNPGGGTIGYKLNRKGDKEYSKVPVDYDPEAIKVSGYVRLFGKKANRSANNGVTVTINGIVGKDGKPLSTTTKSNGMNYGYFEFEQYIPAKSYTMTISKMNYLTRTIEFVVKASDNFEISTLEKPIEIYPGDLDGKRGIQYDDINEYRINWVGRYIKRGDTMNIATFEAFNFYDEQVPVATDTINLYDIGLLVIREGMQSSDYSPWFIN